MITSIFEQLGEQKRHVRELALERISERTKMMLFVSKSEEIETATAVWYYENRQKLKKISEKADQMLLGSAEYNVIDFRLDIDQLVEGIDKSVLQRLVDMI